MVDGIFEKKKYEVIIWDVDIFMVLILWKKST